MASRNLLGLGVALLALLALGTSATQSEAPARSCAFESWGPIGELTIRHAEGHHFCAIDSGGNAIAGGMAPSSEFTMCVEGAAAGPIMVRFDDGIQLVTSDREADWQ